MANILKELKVRGEIQGGNVPTLEDLDLVFSKRDAIRVLHATLIKLNHEANRTRS
jgi:hypothetical protein